MRGLNAALSKTDKLPARPKFHVKHPDNEKVIELVLRNVNETDDFQSVLSPETREELIVRYRQKARKLGRSILRKWHARLDLQEVDSLVDLSLCEAVIRYNPEKGASFMTFLYYHLRGNLIRAVSQAAMVNVVPTTDYEANNESAEAAAERKNQTYRGVNAIEIAEALCSHDYQLPDEALLKKELVDMSYQACSRLDPLEQEVIERIYMQEQQLMDIANMLGYSRCHISRVKRKALETLYDDLTTSMGIDSAAKRPVFDEEEEVRSTRRKVDRRKVHRRRPRSAKAALQKQDLVVLSRTA